MYKNLDLESTMGLPSPSDTLAHSLLCWIYRGVEFCEAYGCIIAYYSTSIGVFLAALAAPVFNV